jgi:5-methylcytosine-specific restriction endonuclease McrA
MRCCCCLIIWDCCEDDCERADPMLGNNRPNDSIPNNTSIGTEISPERLNETKIKKNTAPRRKALNRGEMVKVWKSLYPDTSLGKCKLCRTNTLDMEDSKSWEIAHVKAFAEGGTETLDNLRPLCRTCNRSMGKKSVQDYCKAKFPDDYKDRLDDLKL